MVLLQVVPVLVLGFHTGAVADRVRRRSIMVACQAMIAISCIGLMAILLRTSSVWPYYLAIVAISGLGIYFDSAGGALLPNLVGSQNILTSNAYVSIGRNSADAIGKAAGGFVVALVGAPYALGVASVLYLVSAATVVMISSPGVVDKGNRSTRFLDLAGWRFIGSSGRLLSALLGIAVINVPAAVVSVGLPLIAARDHYGAVLYGSALAVSAAGGVGAGVVLRRVIQPRALMGAALSLVLCAAGVAILAVPVALTFLVGSLLIGASFASTGVFVATVLQSESPDDMRGRVMAARSIVLRVLPALVVPSLGELIRLSSLLVVLVASAGVCLAGALAVGLSATHPVAGGCEDGIPRG